MAELQRSNATQYVVLAGHSLWLRKLFKKFLSKGGPLSSLDDALVSKESKLGNTSVVKFQIDVFEKPSSWLGESPSLTCAIPRGAAKLAYGYIQRSH